jgi:hypothetical protein
MRKYETKELPNSIEFIKKRLNKKATAKNGLNDIFIVDFLSSFFPSILPLKSSTKAAMTSVEISPLGFKDS